MSYFPDYRKETDKLNEVDRAFINGYRKAIDDVKCFFANLDDDRLYTFEKEVIEAVETKLEEWIEASEVETVCALFNEADYLPDGIDLVDANEGLFKSKDD
jgi:hypothetical protein